MPPEPCVISCDTAMEDGNPAVSWGEKLKRGWCVCVYMRGGGSAISRGDNFFECGACNGSWPCIRRDIPTSLVDTRCLWPPSQLPDERYAPHSQTLDSPAANFRERRRTVTSRYPHRHRLGASRDPAVHQSQASRHTTWHIAADESKRFYCLKRRLKIS